MSERARTALWTAGALAVPALLLAAVLILANRVDLFDGPRTMQGSTRVSLALIIFGAAVAWVLFSAMVYVGVSDRLHGVTFSPLYGPALAVKGLIALILTISAIGAVDALAHSLRIAWHITDESEVRLFNALLFLFLVCALAWFLGVMLQLREWSQRSVLAIYSAGGAFGVFVLVVALTLPA